MQVYSGGCFLRVVDGGTEALMNRKNIEMFPR